MPLPMDFVELWPNTSITIQHFCTSTINMKDASFNYKNPSQPKIEG